MRATFNVVVPVSISSKGLSSSVLQPATLTVVFVKGFQGSQGMTTGVIRDMLYPSFENNRPFMAFGFSLMFFPAALLFCGCQLGRRRRYSVAVKVGGQIIVSHKGVCRMSYPSGILSIYGMGEKHRVLMLFSKLVNVKTPDTSSSFLKWQRLP